MRNALFTELSVDELKDLIKEVQSESYQEFIQQLIEDQENVTPADLEHFLNKKEAARIANVSTSTIDNWIRAGSIKKYKLGDAVRIKASEFFAYLNSLSA